MVLDFDSQLTIQLLLEAEIQELSEALNLTPSTSVRADNMAAKLSDLKHAQVAFRAMCYEANVAECESCICDECQEEGPWTEECRGDLKRCLACGLDLLPGFYSYCKLCSESRDRCVWCSSRIK